MKKSFLVTASFLVLSGSIAFAQDSTAPHSPIMPVKIKPAQKGADAMSGAAADIEQEKNVDPEEIGLPFKPSDTNLRPSLWTGYSRVELKQAIETVKIPNSSPTLFNLLKQALSMAPDIAIRPAEKSENTSGKNTSESPADTLSPRLTKLIELGDFEDVFKMYKMLDGNVPSADAALAGTQSMVGTGQMGLACLEDKALDDNLKTNNPKFWSDLASLCQTLLSAETGADDVDPFAKISSSATLTQKFPSVSTLAELNDKSIIHALLLARTNRLPASLFTSAAAQQLNPAALSLLLSQPNLLPAQKLALLSAAVEKGLKTVTDLDTAYRTYATIVSTSGKPAEFGAWQPLLSSYSKLGAVTDDAKVNELKILFNNPSYTICMLLPFARYLDGLQKTSFTADESKKISLILALSENPSYNKWINTHEDDLIPDNTEKSVSGDIQLQATDYIGINVARNFILSNNRDTADIDMSYDNILRLTPSGNYVMPTGAILDNLHKAVEGNQTGKVILLTLQILDGHQISEIHPAVLAEILNALNSMGLNKETNSLAHEALAGFIRSKK